MKICVVGLGYVGLPLAVNFGFNQEVYGFDINSKRIEELKQSIDFTKEVSKDDLIRSKLIFSDNPEIIQESDFIIITVPTPIDDAKRPDLTPLLSACKLVGSNLARDSIVVFESTVYPGCTENDCVPVLEKYSGLKCGIGFKVGYSPERINPGDKEHTVSKITKVVSGWDEESLKIISETYSKIIKAGVHEASSIKVAEAAKIIENTQRDINIALMNELKMIFDKVGIDTTEVLEAAGTKWNFLKFYPGMVGGHCIGVDPYYLAYEAKRLGHHPEIILSGRRINDDMPKYEASRIIKKLVKKDIKIKGAKILILGGTFKPNVPDTRNSKIKELAIELESYGCVINICEPLVTKDLWGYPNTCVGDFDFIIKAVEHDDFKDKVFDYKILE